MQQHQQIDIVLNQLLMQQKNQQETLEKITSEIIVLQEELQLSEQKVTEYERQTVELQKQSLNELQDNIRVSREVLWANIFNNSISESDWLKCKNFSPGRWAIGYPVLYVLYCVLSKAKPQCILELGLGQSTQMITQYAVANPSVKHIVVEHNEVWADFFRKDHVVAENSTIKYLKCIEVNYKERAKINAYQNFKEEVGNEKYDLIIIDAPIGNAALKYQRIDVLSILPDSLADDFVILLDDFNRIGEQNTAKEISAVLKEHNIRFTEGVYKGEKQMKIWCSENMDYLRTL